MDIRNNILASMVDRKLVVRYLHLGGLALFCAAILGSIIFDSEPILTSMLILGFFGGAILTSAALAAGVGKSAVVLLFWAAAAVVVAYAHAISDELYRGPACSTLLLIIFEVGVWLYYLLLSAAGADLSASQKAAVVVFAVSPLVSVPFACRWPGSIWAYVSAPAVAVALLYFTFKTIYLNKSENNNQNSQDYD